MQRWQQVLAELREARRSPWRAPTEVADTFSKALPRCVTALDEADAALVLIIAAARSADRLPPVESPIAVAVEALLHVDDLLHQHSMTKDRYFVGDARTLYSEVRQAVAALQRGEQLARSATTRAAENKLLLLTGRAVIHGT